MSDNTTPPPIEIVRSPNRTKTASARFVDGKVIVRVPADVTAEEAQRLVRTLVPRVLRKEQRRHATDLPNLKRRVADLNRRYFDGNLSVRDIKWVANQNRRYGSCTPANGTIRISDRLVGMPLWVLDYVIMHELAHLVEANHSPAFWRIVSRYPLTERARGYLIAVQLEGDDGPGEDDVE